LENYLFDEERAASTTDSSLLALANLGESPETDVSERAEEILASEIGATTGWSVPHADPR
jgi:predicted aconitase with swiveling domain